MKEKNILPDTQLTKRLMQALTASNEELFQLILDPQPEIVLALLKNRQINEDHLLTLLKRSDLHPDVPAKIYQRWRQSLSHKLIIALVKNPATAGTTVRTLLPQLHLFELLGLCLTPGVSADIRLVSERNILQRLPTTPLGNKITLARRSSTNIVAELFKDGTPALVEACLNNPYLKEAAIYLYLNGPKANAETISLIARHNRWQQRPNLRMAILQNTRTPNIWFTLWLPQLSRPLLKQLLRSRKLSPQQRALVTNEVERRS